MGGNWAFEKAYMNLADLPLAEESMNIPEVQEGIKQFGVSYPPLEAVAIYPRARYADEPYHAMIRDITSTVEEHEYPTQNDQSNFGEGYYYRFGEDGTIEVFMEEASVWKIFKAYEE